MVGAVQAWRRQDPEKAKPVWAALADANLSVEQGLLHLKDAAQSEELYMSTLQACSTSAADKVRKVVTSCSAVVSEICNCGSLEEIQLYSLAVVVLGTGSFWVK